MCCCDPAQTIPYFFDCLPLRLPVRRPFKVVAVTLANKMGADCVSVAGGGASKSVPDRLRSASVYSQRLKRRLVMTRQSFGILRRKPGNGPGRFSAMQFARSENFCSMPSAQKRNIGYWRNCARFPGDAAQKALTKRKGG